MIFYESSTKTYFNPPDYTHMHSRTDINQHGRQLIRSPSLSEVLIITPSPSAELKDVCAELSSIDFFLKILPLKDDKLLMSEM